MARLKVVLIAYPAFWPRWRKEGVTFVVAACAASIVTRHTSVVCSSPAMVIVV